MAMRVLRKTRTTSNRPLDRVEGIAASAPLASLSRRSASFALAAVLALALAAVPRPVWAQEEYEVTVTDSGVVTNALDFFGYSELLPGDAREGRALIFNGTSKPQTVGFFARLTGNAKVSQELMRSAELTVINDGEAIFEGPLEGAGAPAGGVSLCTLAPSEQSEMEWTLAIPSEVDNEIASSYGEVEWGWTANESAPLVKAGDTSMLSELALLALGVMTLMGLCSWRRRSKGEEAGRGMRGPFHTGTRRIE